MSRTADKEYLIHYYEADYRKRCLITSLLNYFQDLAFLHSDRQGAGLDYLADNKLAWVLYRLDARISKYPLYREKVTISTQVHSFVKFYAYRRFAVADAAGTAIAAADTVWLLVNTATKKPVKITGHMYEAFGVDNGEGSPLQFEAIGELTAADITHEYRVRYSDIDTNRHVNNVKYVDWAIETVPVNIIEDYCLTGVRVVYKQEATYGMSLKVHTQTTPTGDSTVCLHRIAGSDGQDLCRLETTWKQG